jgi:hypothetical protein
MIRKPPWYFTIAGIVTALCLGGAAFYVHNKWDLVFANLQPSEWGEFLAGVSALLAFIWAAIAAVFQLHALLNEATKSNKETADANLEHLQERLGREILTLAHRGERSRLHGPNGESALLSDFVGTYQQCAEYAGGREYVRLIGDVEVGLKRFVENIDQGWAIDVNEIELEDLAADIGVIKGTCERISAAVNDGAKLGDWPDSQKVVAFKTRVESALDAVRAIQKVCSQLDAS